MGQPKPKRQHYVPQWHLRRFRDPSAKAGRHYVTAYDKVSDRLHPRIAIANVAVETDFYTLEAPDQPDAYSVEKQLAIIDERENDLFGRILARRSVSRADIPAVRSALESLHARTPDLRKRIEHTYRHEIQLQVGMQLEDEVPPGDWPSDLRTRLPEYVNVLKRSEWRMEHEKDVLIAIQFRQDSTFPKGLAGFRSFVVVCLSYPAFVTSDNPFVGRRLAYPQWGPVMDIGLNNAVDLWLPLDPSHALLATRTPVGCSTLIDLPIERILAINNALMRASDRWTIWQPGSVAAQFVDLPRGRSPSSER